MLGSISVAALGHRHAGTVARLFSCPHRLLTDSTDSQPWAWLVQPTGRPGVVRCMFCKLGGPRGPGKRKPSPSPSPSFGTQGGGDWRAVQVTIARVLVLV